MPERTRPEHTGPGHTRTERAERAPSEHPFERYRSELESLDWSRGLDVDDLRVQLPGLPPSVLGAIVSGHRYRSFGEFWEATRHAPTGGARGLATGPVNVGGTWATDLGPGAPTNSDV